MVDLLSLRIVQLESKLVDEQEAYENLEAVKHELEDKLNGQREDTGTTVGALDSQVWIYTGLVYTENQMVFPKPSRVFDLDWV